MSIWMLLIRACSLKKKKKKKKAPRSEIYGKVDHGKSGRKVGVRASLSLFCTPTPGVSTSLPPRALSEGTEVRERRESLFSFFFGGWGGGGWGCVTYWFSLR